MATSWILDPTDPSKAILGGLVLHNVHSPNKCFGRPCVIHAPTDHHMREWPLNWRDDRALSERLCPHGIGHPDPDAPPWESGVHGCDGCCHA